jgi:hypothetical protein
LRITNDRLSITDQELDKCQADLEKCKADLEKAQSRIERLSESNTDIRFRLSKKEEQIQQLDDRITMVEDMMQKFNERNRKKRSAPDDDRPAKRQATAPEEELPATSGPVGSEIPPSPSALLNEEREKTTERDVEEPPAHTLPNFIGPIMPTRGPEERVSEDCVDEAELDCFSTNSAPKNPISEGSPPSTMAPLSSSAMLPPPPPTVPPLPDVTIQPPTPQTSQEAAEAGLLKVPEKQHADQPVEPHSLSLSRSPAPLLSERRRSPRLNSPDPPPRAGSSKRGGDGLDQPPSKKQREA